MSAAPRPGEGSPAELTLAAVLGTDFRFGAPSSGAAASPGLALGEHLKTWRSAPEGTEFLPVKELQAAPLTEAVRSVLGRPLGQLLATGLLAVSAPGRELYYPADAAEATALIPDSTVIITSLAGLSPVLAGQVSRLTEATGQFSSVSLYCSRPGSARFNWHIDNWLSFIVQVHGTKVFEFRHPGTGDPIECVLTPGDGLAFAPLVRHRAKAASPSVHLAFAVHTAAPGAD